jgi:uncharacterized membrane protein
MGLYLSSKWNCLDKEKKTVALSLMVFSLILILTGFVIGIADNPTGISFLFVGMVSMVFSFTQMQNGYRIYLKLFIVSLIGFIISVLLHNLLYAFAEINHDVSVIYNMINFVSALYFILAVIIFPVTAFVGLTGFIVTYMKNKKYSNKIPL